MIIAWARGQMVKQKKGLYSAKIKKVNSLQWVFEPLEARSDFLQKKMFGCQAGYLNDRLVLVLADSEDPWNGVLIPTEREFHASLQKEFLHLKPHPVLGKWLYLPQNTLEFEEIAAKIVEYIQASDPRFGVDPKPKKAKKGDQNVKK
jgi:hypothetical protein